MSVWVGVDPGERYLGVARSDALGMLARPVAVLHSEKEVVEQLLEWHRDEPLAGLVVGLPLNMDGTVGPIARRSLTLVKRLREQLPFDVLLWDERLSSRQAARGASGRDTRIDDRMSS